MMKIFLMSFISVCLWLSCKPSVTEQKSAETEAVSSDLQHYENEIMKIHDEAMPWMNDIHELSSKLREIRADAPMTEEEKKNVPPGLDETLEALRTAENSMMDWMKDYSDNKARMPAEQMHTFYERELEKVTQVKTTMLNAIEKANAWLAAHPS